MSDEIPAVIRRELNADVDRDVLTRMRYLARKKRTLQPDITDEEMADYLALAENFQNFAQWLSARRGASESPFHSGAAWMAVILVVASSFTVMLMAAIAITV